MNTTTDTYLALMFRFCEMPRSSIDGANICAGLHVGMAFALAQPEYAAALVTLHEKHLGPNEDGFMGYMSAEAREDFEEFCRERPITVVQEEQHGG